MSGSKRFCDVQEKTDLSRRLLDKLFVVRLVPDLVKFTIVDDIRLSVMYICSIRK